MTAKERIRKILLSLLVAELLMEDEEDEIEELKDAIGFEAPEQEYFEGLWVERGKKNVKK